MPQVKVLLACVMTMSLLSAGAQAAPFCSAKPTAGFRPAIARVADRPALYLSDQEIEAIRSQGPCRSAVRKVIELKKSFDAGKATSLYDVEILPTRELISGKPGSYYRVFLKDARLSRKFLFAAGSYTIPEFDTKFRAALSDFVRDALALLEGSVDYGIFVRGSATSDKLTRERRLKNGFSYTSVEYLPAAANGSYVRPPSGEPASARAIPDAYANDDLPFLRAAFLQDIVYRYYRLHRPVVLESAVAATEDVQARSAELILFVDW